MVGDFSLVWYSSKPGVSGSFDRLKRVAERFDSNTLRSRYFQRPAQCTTPIWNVQPANVRRVFRSCRAGTQIRWICHCGRFRSLSSWWGSTPVVIPPPRRAVS